MSAFDRAGRAHQGRPDAADVSARGLQPKGAGPVSRPTSDDYQAILHQELRQLRDQVKRQERQIATLRQDVDRLTRATTDRQEEVIEADLTPVRPVHQSTDPAAEQVTWGYRPPSDPWP